MKMNTQGKDDVMSWYVWVLFFLFFKKKKSLMCLKQSDLNE